MLYLFMHMNSSNKGKVLKIDIVDKYNYVFLTLFVCNFTQRLLQKVQ